ncbi:DNA gyrase inhibitor YacG [Xanthobacter sp. KR7-65]|uniref:DNA gyrase inhibitor YacG n=1 Tax=Xanthobacter sp. KR7-65 TaxID=3156612 RepID=UPI0032B5CC12
MSPAKPKAPAAGDAKGDPSAPAAKPCPICSKLSVERYRPFCSKRCADVDLNRWLSGSYAIPGRPEEDEDGEGSQD